MINSFKGEHRWLSNFWPTYVQFDGELYPSVENAYVAAKFDKERTVQMLLDTGSQELVEGNVWHDNFWGNCTCSKCPEPGENHLGKLLMKIRSEL